MDSGELPDDAPKPPAGFGEPHLYADDEPLRYNCLVCGERYFTDNTLREHVEEDHSTQDIFNALRPANIPTIAWYDHSDSPADLYTHEAALYAQRALPDDFFDSQTPEPIQRQHDNCCPVCGEQAGDTHAVSLARSHDHPKWEIYQVLRDIVPDKYEYSPIFDDGGYDDPAATINRLQPGDIVSWQSEGWSQSLGTPRGQTRDSISDDTEWEGIGLVVNVEDSRVGYTPPTLGENEIDREVDIKANIDIRDDPAYVTMEPRNDGTVSITLDPTVSQHRASQQHGHGGAGLTKSTIEPPDSIQRQPWYDVDQ